jgi:hypothetical protein
VMLEARDGHGVVAHDVEQNHIGAARQTTHRTQLD